MAKSMAAGYYELTPALLEDQGIHWQGPSPDELKREHGVWPDFHHYNDLKRSGKLVDFLPREAADLFSLWGPPKQIVGQLLDVIRSAPAALDYVVLQPIPDPVFPDAGEAGYTEKWQERCCRPSGRHCKRHKTLSRPHRTARPSRFV
jgi:hypothetical protein